MPEVVLRPPHPPCASPAGLAARLLQAAGVVVAAQRDTVLQVAEELRVGIQVHLAPARHLLVATDGMAGMSVGRRSLFPPVQVEDRVEAAEDTAAVALKGKKLQFTYGKSQEVTKGSFLPLFQSFLLHLTPPFSSPL